jgi:hypothetical protein
MSLRLKAFGLHLLVSTTLLSAFTGLVLLTWYAPWPLLSLQGGVKILELLLLVDVVLGPSLTWLVFKPEKSRRMLAIDMSVVFLVQMLAFGYGAWTLYSERPLFLAFVEDRFDVLLAPDADLAKLPKSISVPGFFAGSQLVNVNVPNSQKMAAMLYRFSNNPGFALHTELYQPFPGTFTAEQFAKNALPFDEVMKSPETATKINAFLASQKIPPAQALLFPINGRNDQAIAVIDKDSLKLLGLVDAKI